MKRILALLLVLAMSFGLFAGCRTQTPDVTTEPTTQATEQAQPDLQLEKAIEYLRAFYKNAAEKTPMDYTRLGTVRIGLTAYDVVWSTDAPEEVLKIVKNEDGTYTIDIDEEAFKESFHRKAVFIIDAEMKLIGCIAENTRIELFLPFTRIGYIDSRNLDAFTLQNEHTILRSRAFDNQHFTGKAVLIF